MNGGYERTFLPLLRRFSPWLSLTVWTHDKDFEQGSEDLIKFAKSLPSDAPIYVDLNKKF
jgi:hypothetical protein